MPETVSNCHCQRRHQHRHRHGAIEGVPMNEGMSVMTLIRAAEIHSDVVLRRNTRGDHSEEAPNHSKCSLLIAKKPMRSYVCTPYGLRIYSVQAVHTYQSLKPTLRVIKPTKTSPALREHSQFALVFCRLPQGPSHMAAMACFGFTGAPCTPNAPPTGQCNGLGE